MNQRFVMVVFNEKCVRCKACAVACRAENDIPDQHSRNWITESPERGRFPNLGISFEPGQCMQCDNPHCARVCPAGATEKGGRGIVHIDRNKCIGCRYCMLACPYDARYYDEEAGVVDKCNFCFDGLRRGKEPACVSTCPSRARVFGDINDPRSEVSKLLAKHRTQRRKVEAGTGPAIYYIEG